MESRRGLHENTVMRRRLLSTRVACLLHCAAASGFTLIFLPWGGNRKRIGLALLGIGLASLAIWAALKPQMFFHFNPGAGMSLPDNPELWTARAEFGLRLLGSGWAVAAFSPAALIAGLPVIGGMLASGHEWHRLVGPGAHHVPVAQSRQVGEHGWPRGSALPRPTNRGAAHRALWHTNEAARHAQPLTCIC